MPLLSVSKLKPMLFYYLPYPNAFPGVVVLPIKQALKLMLVISTPSAAPPASSTRSCIYTANTAPVSNTRDYSCTTSITPKASINKYRKLSTFSLRLFKLS